MKSLITVFSEAHVLVTIAFYFSIITLVFLSSVLKEQENFDFKAFLIPLGFSSILFLFSNTLSVFKLILLGEIIYYLSLILHSFTKKIIPNFIFYIIGLILSLFIKFSNSLSFFNEINVRWYSISIIFCVVLYIFLNNKKNNFIYSKTHFINAVSSLIFIFGFSKDGVFLMLLIRIVFILMLIKNLKEIEQNTFKTVEKRYELIQKDFDDEVRKMVKTHMFHMEMSKERMAEIVKQDDMTGVFNKKTIIESIKDKILDKRTKTFSILMYDIDNFKSINDGFGHIQGDKCIKELAKISQEIIRSGDIVGRYGGDEFIILLSQADLNNAVMVAERLRKSVEKTVDPNYTVSIGISNYPKDGNNPKDLIKHADDGLYIAKKKGKNSLGYFNETKRNI